LVQNTTVNKHIVSSMGVRTFACVLGFTCSV
jgi:hypothetical protein